MEFKTSRYRVLRKDKKTRSKWVGLVEEMDIIQFKIYSEGRGGRGGSGTTYHLYMDDELQLPNGKEGDLHREEDNAFGANVLRTFTNNLELEELGI